MANSMVPFAGFREWLGLFFGTLRGVRVEGDSMSPTLREGDRVIVRRSRTFAEGDLVLARHPYRRNVTIIKRIAELDTKGRFVLAGDNPSQSSDSRVFGSIAPEAIIGKVSARLRP